MAGIYVHIPFCKVKCNYCDFHFSTNQKLTQKVVDSICQELIQKKEYLKGEEIKTIYFGGGTPSIIKTELLQQIVNTISLTFDIVDDVEFTFECNPDDLNVEKLKDLKELGVNRLSIGIQSFENEQLEFMNRAHNSDEALNCVQLAQDNGFSNITIDLIYGIPNAPLNYWEKQIQKALELNVNHISAYCLTIEDKTVFGNWFKAGKLKLVEDEESLDQFKMLQSELNKNGYEHYEISNFSKNGFISNHNSAYWLGENYIGIGPSAHSYNGESRQWNVANNIKYINGFKNKITTFEIEELSQVDRFNEFILTRLRTKWGVDLESLFLIDNNHKKQTLKTIDKFVKNNDLELIDNSVYITQQGKFIVDYISSELFI
jgi:oxygen-independent coproporphyrinogen-3 oxidase